MSDDVTVPRDFYISPSEAARLLQVTVKDVYKFQDTGKLRNIRTTPGNHRRYNLYEVLSLCARMQGDSAHG